MRTTKLFVLASALAACAAGEVRAGVIGIFWERSDDVWDLYAAMTPDTKILNADLGDVTITEPPDGVNTGLYSTMGAMIFADSYLTIGGVAPSFARPFTITPSGTGSYADAAWFVVGGVMAQFHVNVYSDYALQLGHFVAESGAMLSDDMGGPLGDIQSRIYLGWQDTNGVAFGVFNVPAPASAFLLAIGGVSQMRRRRRNLRGS